MVAQRALGSKLFRCSMLRNNNLRFMEDVEFNEDIIFEREAVFCAGNAASMGDYLHIYRMNPSSITHNNRCSLSNATIVASVWYRIRTWAKDINVSEENKSSGNYSVNHFLDNGCLRQQVAWLRRGMVQKKFWLVSAIFHFMI